MDRESRELPRTSDSISNSLDDIPTAGEGVVSEKVQYFANAIYGQLENIVKKYDEDAVKDLMPHVISLLESLNQLSNEKRQLEVDIELIKEDNSQLLVQYEREKTMRRSIEQKCLEIEDLAEEEREGLNDKVASMESIVRMLELKSKNSADHVARLEEKEAEMKKDHAKLYQKYQELMRSHIDIMERRAYNEHATESGHSSAFDHATLLQHRLSEEGDSLMAKADDAQPDKSGSRLDQFNQVGLPDYSNTGSRNRGGFSRQTVVGVSFGGGGGGGLDASSSHNYNVRDSSHFYDHQSSSSHSFAFVPTSHAADSVSKSDAATVDATSRFEEELSFQEDDLLNTPSGRHRARKGDNEQDSSDDDGDVEIEPEDTLGSTPLGLSLGVSDFNAPGKSTFSVGREFDKLLRENAELLETKNALNVVKDDLIFQVDGLNNELRIYRERIASLEQIRELLQLRVSQLEEEGKHVKDELDEVKQRLSASSGSNGNAEDEGGSSGQEGASTGAEGTSTQRRRFTRMEMARVLMERNIYKERLIELQETVRWVESLRASREHPEMQAADQRKKTSIWNFFGGLFSSSSPKPKHMPSPLPPPPPMPPSLMDVNLGAGRISTAVDIADRPRRSFISQSNGPQGRVEAYGWSIPVSTCFTPSHGMARSRAANRAAGVAAPPGALVTSKPDVSVAIPVCCQPLPGSLNGMKIWSAAVAFSSFGIHPDGSRLFERSVFYGSPRNSSSVAPRRSSTSGSGETPTPEDGVMPVSADVAELEEEVSLEQHRVKASRGQLAELSSVAWLTCSSNNVNTHVFLVDLRQPSVLLAGFTLDAPYVSQVCAVPGAKPTDMVWQPVTTVTDTPTAAGVGSGSRRGSKGEADMQDDCVEMSRDHEKRAALSNSGWCLSVTEQVKLKNLAPKIPGDSSASKREEDGGGEEDGALIDNTKSLLMPTMWFGAQDGTLFVYSGASTVQPSLQDLPQQLPAIFGRIKLPSAPTAIGHVAGRVFVALASSEIVMFHRNPETKEWCLDECSIIEFKRDLATPTPTPPTNLDNNDGNKTNTDDPLAVSRTISPTVVSSTSAAAIPAARCLVAVANRYLWVGLGREVLVIEPASLRIESTFICHPRPDAQLRYACSVGDGVWLAVRIDSVLRLYHAFTHQHLQDLDLQPAIHSFIFGDATPTPGSSSSALSPMRVSAMVAGGGRLWIGTHTGLIVSVPFASAEQQISVKTTSGGPSTPVSKQPSSGTGATQSNQGPGTIVQVFASPRSHTLTPGTNMVPYCWVGGAQISCHGHTDSVKSIVCSPVQASGSPQSDTPPEGGPPSAANPNKNGIPSLAIMSIGEGYRDCRSPSAIQAAMTAAGDSGNGSGVGLSAILSSSSPPSSQIGGAASAMLRPSVTISPSPPGEERIHMIVWQLALSGQ